MTADITIVLASDHRYLPGLLATLASMILSASNRDRLDFRVFADGLDDSDCQKVRELAARCGLSQEVQFLHPDMTRIRSLFKPYKGSHAAFLRLFLCDLLSVDWVVYADVDTLWFRDIGELWDERDDGVSILWCRDLPSIAQGVKEYTREYCPDLDVERYACSGVALMNLKRMREMDFVEKCAAFAERWGTPPFVDQDILNVILLNDAKLLDQRWDCLAPDRDAVNGVVLHFNGIGAMFNGPMTGWRVLYYIWYRFTYDIVMQAPDKSVCSPLKRICFWLAGTCYPNARLIQRCFSWVNYQLPDNVTRYLFFAWLLRHAGPLFDFKRLPPR